MDRRAFFLNGVHFISAWILSPSVHAKEATVLVTNSHLDAFPFFLDTLLPEDESPSATQLAIHHKIIGHAENIENYPKLLMLGCQWLDQIAKKNFNHTFADISQAQRNRVVRIAENQAENKLAKIFFTRVLSDSFYFYYANPRSWISLGLSSTPQPQGFLDYSKAPILHLNEQNGSI